MIEKESTSWSKQQMDYSCKTKKENQGKELQVTANFVGTGKECLVNADIPSTSLADFSIVC
jgi:hypothetical protein